MAPVREQESAEAVVPRATSRVNPEGLTTREGPNQSVEVRLPTALPVTTKPSGRVIAQRLWQLEHGASSDDLLEQILSPENLKRAWLRVKANGGAAGVDGMTIAQFPAFARQHS